MGIRQIATAISMCVAASAAAQQVSFDVSGDDARLARKLRDNSFSVTLEQDPTRSAQDVLSNARADYRRLTMGLYAAGYYGGRVSIQADGREVAQISQLRPPQRVRTLSISVDPGPQFRFGALAVSPLPQGTALLEGFTRGAVARADAIRDAGRAGIAAWRAQGHAKARISGEAVTADHQARRLDAALQVAPGPRLRFGPLSIQGDTAVRPARIRAIADLPEGAVFDPKELARATARLRSSGVFASVALDEAKSWTPDMRLPMTALITDKKPRRIGAGLEYSTSRGGTASAFWMHRNAFGGAERLRFDARVTGLGRVPGHVASLGARLDRPASFGPKTDLFVWAEAERLSAPPQLGHHLDLGAGAKHRLSDTLTLTGAVGLRAGRVSGPAGRRSYAALTAPLTLTDDRRSDRQDPKSGSYIALTATPFLGLRGTQSGAHATADARAYLSFGAEQRVTLAGRLQMGSLVGPSSAEAPPEYLFYSGGGGTVRGQDYQSLGVAGPTGLEGGRSLIAASLEARAKVMGNWSGAAFADAGYVSGGSVPLRGGAAHAGVGLGMRYDSPVGLIRVDLATPATGAQAFRRGHVYIGVGQAF